jgi:putative tryptophan/tyrosine transport system substrate-binding protein
MANVQQVLIAVYGSDPVGSAMPVAGSLDPRGSVDSASVVAAFRRGLKEISYVEGQNLVIGYQWANGQCERLPTIAADLVRRRK